MIRMTPGFKNREVLIELDKAVISIRKGLRQALFEIGQENVKHCKKLILDPPKTGRIYTSKVKPSPHQASATNQPPADWTGALRKNVKYKVYGHDRMEFGDGVIKTGNAKRSGMYGLFLELGTKRIRPRPHVARTMREKQKDNFKTILRAYNP